MSLFGEDDGFNPRSGYNNFLSPPSLFDSFRSGKLKSLFDGGSGADSNDPLQYKRFHTTHFRPSAATKAAEPKRQSNGPIQAPTAGGGSGVLVAVSADLY